MKYKLTIKLFLVLLLPFLIIDCSSSNEFSNSETLSNTLYGTIEIDGSSTVALVSEAVAEEFKKLYPKANVLVGISGTGGGFKRFTLGEIDISDASRAIKNSEDIKAKNNNIDYSELRIGMDGLSVMVNPNNDFVDCLTISELHVIWKPGSKIIKWNQIRSNFPDKKIRLYGPGTDSGTFAFFTDIVNDEEGASRDDYTASEDDNVLIRGIAGDNYSLGYFGYAYYVSSKDKLKIIGIDKEDGNGCIVPDLTTIDSGLYPITRPLYIYVNKSSYMTKPVVKEFVRFFLQHASKLTAEVGYVPLKAEEYKDNLGKLN
ncbi:MAG: phosphate ABC transporter substrate-binding protein [Chloroflexi bacterium]|nr:phosphate ABC transporter substrate-binding protein [Chloroflexota bacterium]|tara:strand:- start:10557 stop:11504 length:948 start_codon:yes stop_codon:yes gene_type:complete